MTAQLHRPGEQVALVGGAELRPATVNGGQGTPRASSATPG